MTFLNIHNLNKNSSVGEGETNTYISIAIYFGKKCEYGLYIGIGQAIGHQKLNQ